MPEQSEHHQQMHSVSRKCKKLQELVHEKRNRKIVKLQSNMKGIGCFDKEGIL